MSDIEFLEPYAERIVLSGDSQTLTVDCETSINTFTDTEGVNFIETSFYELVYVYIKNNILAQMINTSKELLYILLINLETSKDYFEIPRFYLSLAKNKELIGSQSSIEFIDFFIENSVISTVRDIPKQNIVKRVEKTQEGKSKIKFYLTRRDSFKNYGDDLSLYLCIKYPKRSDINIRSTFKDLQVSGERIITKGKISQETFSYYIRNTNLLWEGKIIERSGQFYTDERIQRPLVKRAHYNNKIQDRRARQTRSAPTTNRNTKIDKFGTLQTIDDKYFIKTTDSPIKFIERNGNGINLSIDLLGLLRKNSLAYNMIGIMTEKDLADFSFLDLKVYRKRVVEDLPVNSNSSDVIKKDFFENEQRKYLPKSNIIIGKSGFTIAVSINDIEFARQISAGDYCYGIEVYFVDPIVKLLEREILSFRKVLSELQQYYFDSTLTGYFDIDSNYVEGNYDPGTNRVTNKFIEKWDNKGLEDRASEECAKMLRRNKYPEQEIKQMLENLIVKLLSRSSTPDSISEFINFYENNLNIITNVYETNKNNNLIVEEKYFGSFYNKVSKRSEIPSLQQFPFSLKRYVFLQTGYGGNISTEQQTVPGNIVLGNLYLVEDVNSYEEFRNILEDNLDLNIRDDFSKIEKVAPTTSEPSIYKIINTSTQVDLGLSAESNDTQSFTKILVNGKLATPSKTNSITIKNSPVSSFITEGSNKE